LNKTLRGGVGRKIRVALLKKSTMRPTSNVGMQLSFTRIEGGVKAFAGWIRVREERKVFRGKGGGGSNDRLEKERFFLPDQITKSKIVFHLR